MYIIYISLSLLISSSSYFTFDNYIKRFKIIPILRLTALEDLKNGIIISSLPVIQLWRHLNKEPILSHPLFYLCSKAST